MGVKIYLYPLWLRIWHWINALIIVLLIITGISMQYSNPEYPFMRFDLAVSIHNISGILLTAGYVFFLIFNLSGPNGKYYRLQIKGLGNKLMKQFRYYLTGIFKGEKAPFPISEKRKFNPLQKVTYVLVMYIGMPLIFITGWALLFPEVIIHNFLGASGLYLTALFHVVTGFFLSIFLFIHIYFATIGKTAASNFRAMFNGWHEAHD